MTPSRREFLWTAGAAAGALAWLSSNHVPWSAQEEEGSGWTPGIEERINGACLACPGRCGIRGRVVDGRLVRITGNRLHPLSRGGLCARGVAGVQTLYHPDRLASPLVRVGRRGDGAWREVSHAEAIALIGDRLRSVREAGRPEALAALVGYCEGTMHDVWRQLFQAFGSPNCVFDGYEDGTEAAMEVMHGIRRRPGYDLEGAEVVVSFGAPLFESWWSPVQAYRGFGWADASELPRRRLIQVDHRFSRTAAYGHEWVGVRPGTHAALALGMAYVILRDRLYDAAFLAAHVRGFEDFTDESGRHREGFRSLVLQRYRTEEVSATTGVPVERVTELARVFASSRSGVAVCGQDVTLAPDGLRASMAVHCLNVLVGSVNRPGGVVFGDGPPLQPLALLPSDAVSEAGLTRAPIAGPPPAFGQGDLPRRLAEAVAAGSEGTVDTLLVHGANPLGVSSRPDVWERALMKIPFLVSFSPFLDETALHADVVLPDLLPYERWQDAPTPASYPYPVWGVTHPMCTPHPGGRHTGEVLFELARLLGGVVGTSLPYDSFEQLLKSRARGLFDARRGRTFAAEFETENQRRREERGWWLATQSDFESFWSELVDRGGWADLYYDSADPDRLARTPSGRIDLMPAAVLRAQVSQGSDGGLYDHASREDERGGPDYPLRLLPYRATTLSPDPVGRERWLAERPGVLPDTPWIPWVSVSPATATETALEEGRMVWVVSSRARYRARLQVSPGAAPKTVCAPYGLSHPDGEPANPLHLLDDVYDPLTGHLSWFTTFVRLEPDPWEDLA